MIIAFEINSIVVLSWTNNITEVRRIDKIDKTKKNEGNGRTRPTIKKPKYAAQPVIITLEN